MGATDPDGNTLVYSLQACSQNGTNPVTYDAGFSAASPLGATWGVAINPNTGDLTFTASPGLDVTGVVCVRVTQLNSMGIPIGSVVRDMEVIAGACNNSLPTLSGPYTQNACVGQELCFNVTGFDADIDDELTITVLSNPSNAQVQINNGSAATAQVCFTPTTAGTSTIVLQVKDDHCPRVGLQQYTYTINSTVCDPCDAIGINMNWTHTEALLSTTVTNATTTNAGYSVSFTEFIWGDGSSTMYGGNYTTPETHTYAAPGWYDVCVVVQVFTNNLCCKDTLCRSIYISDNPCDFFNASFVATQSTPCAINFTNTSTAGAFQTYWNFGDGSPIAFGNNVSHTYASGTYTVTLTVQWHPASNPLLCCTDTYQQTYTINCNHVPPGGGRRLGANVHYQSVEEELMVDVGPEFQEEHDVVVELYDLGGKLLKQVPWTQGPKDQISMAGMSNGLYFVRITSASLVESHKFLKY